jgi:hypothetical protein
MSSQRAAGGGAGSFSAHVVALWLFRWLRGSHRTWLGRARRQLEPQDPLLEVTRVRLASVPAGTRSFRMALHLPGKIEETIARTGAWEPEIAALIAFFLQEASVFVDVGLTSGSTGPCGRAARVRAVRSLRVASHGTCPAGAERSPEPRTDRHRPTPPRPGRRRWPPPVLQAEGRVVTARLPRRKDTDCGPCRRRRAGAPSRENVVALQQATYTNPSSSAISFSSVSTRGPVVIQPGSRAPNTTAFTSPSMWGEERGFAASILLVSESQ